MINTMIPNRKITAASCSLSLIEFIAPTLFTEFADSMRHIVFFYSNLKETVVHKIFIQQIFTPVHSRAIHTAL